MGNEKALLSLTLILVLLIFSYNYVVDETQTAATADPTHSGKALTAEIMPWFWLMLIVITLAAAIYALSESMG